MDERLYALQDANWNVTALADTTGAIQERYTFTAYGISVTLTGTFGARASSSFDWEIRFAGYRWDGEVAFNQVRNRVYLPNLGWIQRDTIQCSMEVNLYEYVRSNPIKEIDPSGRGLPIVLAILGCLTNPLCVLAVALILLLLALGIYLLCRLIQILRQPVPRPLPQPRPVPRPPRSDDEEENKYCRQFKCDKPDDPSGSCHGGTCEAEFTCECITIAIMGPDPTDPTIPWAPTDVNCGCVSR